MRSKQPEGPAEPGRLSDLALQLEAVSGADEEVAGEAHQEERDDGGNLARLLELQAQEVKRKDSKDCEFESQLHGSVLVGTKRMFPFLETNLQPELEQYK